MTVVLVGILSVCLLLANKQITNRVPFPGHRGAVLQSSNLLHLNPEFTEILDLLQLLKILLLKILNLLQLQWELHALR